MERTNVNPPGLEQLRKRLRFSQVVRVGDTLWISGQVGDEKGVPAEGIEAQSRLAFENLRRVLAEAGAILADIVELVTFHRDMSELQTFAGVKAEFMPQTYPAWAAVGTPALTLAQLRVEV